MASTSDYNDSSGDSSSKTNTPAAHREQTFHFTPTAPMDFSLPVHATSVTTGDGIGEASGDLHQTVHEASVAALQSLHFCASDRPPDRHQLPFASPDETLLAIRRGLASPPSISPLGEQGVGNPKVALSDLPLLQSKLSTWRKRYSPQQKSYSDIQQQGKSSSHYNKALSSNKGSAIFS